MALFNKSDILQRLTRMEAYKLVFIALLGVTYVCCFEMRGLMMKQDAFVQHQHSKVPPLDSTPPMRILLIVEPTPFNYISGYANRFKEMLKYLSKAGDTVEVITSDPDPHAPQSFLNFKINTFRGLSFPLYPDVAISFDLKARIRKIIQNFKPDLIHVSTPSAVIIPTVLWAKVLDIPLVMSYHTDLVGYAKSYISLPGAGGLASFLVRKFHAQADLALCTSPQLRDEMLKLGLKRVDVWQKGINTEVFNPSFRNEEMRSYLTNGHPQAPLLLYVGRLGVEKRIHRLKTVLQSNPTARLAVVGAGPAEQTLWKELEGFPVVFTGQLQGERLSQAFASADLFLMPSDTETLGFVVLEAMASGVPVVGVAAGGLIDIIAHGQTGFLAENKDSMEEFSSYVQQLVEDSTLREAMRQNALSFTSQLSWEAATSRLRNVQYRRALLLHRFRDERRRHIEDIEKVILETELIA